MMKNEFSGFFFLLQHSEIIFTYFSSGIVCHESLKRRSRLQLVSHFSTFSPSAPTGILKILESFSKTSHDKAATIHCTPYRDEARRRTSLWWRCFGFDSGALENLCLLFLLLTCSARREAFLLPFERNVLTHRRIFHDTEALFVRNILRNQPPQNNHKESEEQNFCSPDLTGGRLIQHSNRLHRNGFLLWLLLLRESK